MEKIEEILNWRYEENQYVEKAIEDYHKSLNWIARIFMTEKQEQRNIQYVEQNAKLRYREEKLDKMLACIEQDRRRVDDQVEFANKELQRILSEISGSFPQIKFETDVRNYEAAFKEAPMEMKTIELKPYTIKFMQQKLI